MRRANKGSLERGVRTFRVGWFHVVWSLRYSISNVHEFNRLGSQSTYCVGEFLSDRREGHLSNPIDIDNYFVFINIWRPDSVYSRTSGLSSTHLPDFLGMFWKFDPNESLGKTLYVFWTWFWNNLDFKNQDWTSGLELIGFGPTALFQMLFKPRTEHFWMLPLRSLESAAESFRNHLALTTDFQAWLRAFAFWKIRD